MPVLRLAIASPLRRLFDYLPPENADPEILAQLRPGCRLQVPFGSRQVCGILIEQSETSDLPADKLKPALQILDTEPLMSRSMVALCRWAAEYYRHAEGEVLSAALPVNLRQGGALRAGATAWQLTLAGKGLPEGALPRAPKQAALLTVLQQRGSVAWETLAAEGHKTVARRALRDKGLIEEVAAALEPSQASWLEGPPLSAQQQDAVDAVKPDRFGTYLLHGVTGSGKTEVYLRLIAQTLQAGKQALVLVPEIGLTPQLAQRLQERFDAEIALLHSGLADGARENAWNAARTGRAHIVVGTRSAILTSLARPGLIIVDEEHDASFKQQDGFRYSARDVAVKRGQLEKLPVLLGSATPSLETLHNAQRGRYQHLRLSERIGAARLPKISVEDIRARQLRGGLSDTLLDATREQLGAGNQVLLFLNRRGYAPTLQCHDCGFIATCRHCDARLTLHRGARELRCHHCEWRLPQPDRCPDCASRQLNPRGVGTEQTEAVLQSQFPGFPVYRVDRDSMQRRGAMDELLVQVSAGEPCILLGTQMLTKGHHFPGVTLVGLLDTDNSLFSADFRGPERMGQLVTQVAGRAGRAKKPGHVILQTHYPDHPLLRTLLEGGYDPFADSLLEERKTQGLPPFGQMLLARAEARDLSMAEDFLAALRRDTDAGKASMIGPVPAPMHRRSGRYRAQLLVLSRARSELQHVAAQLVELAENSPTGKRIRWSVDVDPLEM